MIQAIAFYLFATILVVCAASVISARNPVHSVLWLILAFFNAAGLMVLVGAEFIAMLEVRPADYGVPESEKIPLVADMRDLARRSGEKWTQQV